MTTRRVFLLSAASCLLILGSCAHNPVAPAIQPGPRDYSWTVDTLNTEFNVITGFWGASANNIWAGGDGGTEADFLWHYDGAKWIPWYATYGGSKGLAYCSAKAIFGFDSNDVWIGGQSFGEAGAGLCHWNGSRWGQYFNYKPDPDSFSVVLVTDIWGPAPNEVFACGVMMYSPQLVPQGTSMRGFLLRYDGSEWRQIARGDSGYQCQFEEVKGENGLLFVEELAGSIQGTDSSTINFYELAGNKLSKIYSNKVGQISNPFFEFVGNTLYFPFGKDVYAYTDGAFNKVLTPDIPGYFGNCLFGRSAEDIFICVSGGLVHFNGSDYRYLYDYPSGQAMVGGGEGGLFNKDVFIVLYDGSTSTNMILHGTLKQ